MIQEGTRGSECRGYATFLKLIKETEIPLIKELQKDVENLTDKLNISESRLFAFQNALIDLLKFVDPKYIHFSEERRTKAKKEEEKIKIKIS